MGRYLIVNADDFGWTEGINEGILSAHCSGIVTSATLLATGRAAKHAVKAAFATPSLAVGVHLSYHFGTPLIDPRKLHALFRPDGTPRYNTVALWLAATVSSTVRADLRDHFRSQIDWVISKGLIPTHLDTHKHVHFWPVITDLLCQLANEFSIPAVRLLAEPGFPFSQRISPVSLLLTTLNWTTPINRAYMKSYLLDCPQRFMGIVMTGHWTKHALLDILSSLLPGWTELMVHPGRPAGLEREPTRLVQSRQRELEILTDPEVRQQCQSNNIKLASYRELAAKA